MIHYTEQVYTLPGLPLLLLCHRVRITGIGSRRAGPERLTPCQGVLLSGDQLRMTGNGMRNTGQEHPLRCIGALLTGN